MKKAERMLLFLLTLTSTSALAFAQSGSDAGGACGTLACGAGGLIGLIIYLLIIAVCLAIPIVLIVLVIKFIKKDATSRGMPNADSIKWLGLLGVLGLVIYLLQRPDTTFTACPTCGKPRVPGQPCPHCGNA